MKHSLAPSFCSPTTSWAFCQGQILSISQYDALFSLLGTTYGGDGISTFALPALRGRAPVCQGQAPGKSNYELGEAGGAASHTLLTKQLPAHSHDVQVTMQLQVSNTSPSSDEASGGFLTNTTIPFYAASQLGSGHLGGMTATGTTGPISKSTRPYFGSLCHRADQNRPSHQYGPARHLLANRPAHRRIWAGRQGQS